uniref:G3BP stress granule assembly factor 2b n=1 Tax=Erpetoichthys calabaricus TaxID=27687 RepID=A0A8C4X486_ERPCA
MVMEKPSPLLVGREFVRQYYTLLNKAPDFLHRFYGRNSSYVHGGLEANGKPAEAVYGQAEIHKKVMSLLFSECHTKIRHVDAHATLNDGVVVQVIGELSNNGQPMRKFMQTFVLAPEGSVANKFYVHNDIFRYEDEVFGDSEAELDEGMYANVDKLVYGCHCNFYYSNGVAETLEEPTPEMDPEPEPEQKSEELKPEIEEKVLEELEERTPSPPFEPTSSTQEPPKVCLLHSLQAFSWASVTSKNLPPSGSVPSSGIPPHVVKAPASQPRVEPKQEAQAPPPRVRDQRTRERPGYVARGPRSGRGDAEPTEMDTRRIVRYPDSHQLFVGNLPHDIDENELKDFFMRFGNVVELILAAKPIMFRGEVRLNVEEKKTRAVRERETRGGDDRRDMRRNDRGPGGPRGVVGGGMMRDRDGRCPPSRGGLVQKLGPSSGRGAGQGESRFSTQRR